MSNLPTTLDEAVKAMQTLRANGWLLTQSIFGGINATLPGRKRYDGQTAADLIALAREYEPKTEKPATAPEQ